SSCEFFAYVLSLLDNVTVIGYYPSAGLGGNITPVYLPGGLYMQFTTGRALNAEGGIRLEGIGVVPDVIVPVNEETLFAEGDVLLDE
ncbi:MAG TPA: S41 family peptidase, partial [Aggregatilineales bacterium]|nr:S41 family peptidase [Aggregatilineales bacterium]